MPIMDIQKSVRKYFNLYCTYNILCAPEIYKYFNLLLYLHYLWRAEQYMRRIPKSNKMHHQDSKLDAPMSRIKIHKNVSLLKPHNYSPLT